MTDDDAIEVPLILWLRRPGMYVRYLRTTDETTPTGGILHGLADLLEGAISEARQDEATT